MIPLKKKAPTSSLIIFTDLDGTLLDHYTYSFAPAHQALKKIADAHIPLIFCSSKTRAEIDVWRKKIPNHYPFVVENGGAIFFPPDWEISVTGELREKDGYHVLETGTAHPDLMVQFELFKRSLGGELTGLSEMAVEQIARITGLSKQNAGLAKKREYSEPFIFSGDRNDFELLEKMVSQRNLTLTRGGRFFHLMGDNDKGKAVYLIAEIYRKHVPEVKTVALGDSANDRSMVAMADVGIMVQKPGGGYDETLKKLPNIVRARGVGPAGWNQALLKLLETV